MVDRLDYDPTVLVEYARRLYARAHWLTFRMTLAGALLGSLGGFGVVWMGGQDGATVIGAGGVACVGLLLGMAVGSARAFWLKLRAQQILCQVMIEGNTRRIAGLLKGA